jgi:hypothetical protein
MTHEEVDAAIAALRAAPVSHAILAEPVLHYEMFGKTDQDLVRAAVRSLARRALAHKTPAWAAIKHYLAVGSTLAHNLCLRFGVDPETGKELSHD